MGSYLRYLIDVCWGFLERAAIQDAVKNVAEELMEKKELSGKEIYELCNSVEGFNAAADRVYKLYFPENRRSLQEILGS